MGIQVRFNWDRHRQGYRRWLRHPARLVDWSNPILNLQKKTCFIVIHDAVTLIVAISLQDLAIIHSMYLHFANKQGSLDRLDGSRRCEGEGKDGSRSER